MKKIFLLLICLFVCSGVNAEKINDARYYVTDLHKKEFNEQNFPLMYNYFKDYAQEIFWKFDITKYPRPGFFIGEGFYLNRDGSFDFFVKLPNKKDYKNDIAFRNFLLKNPPPPFPKGMDDERIWVSFDVINDKISVPSDIISMYVFEHNRTKDYVLSISLYKSSKHMHMTKRKCQRQGYNWNDAKNYCEITYKIIGNKFDP